MIYQAEPVSVEVLGTRAPTTSAETTGGIRNTPDEMPWNSGTVRDNGVLGGPQLLAAGVDTVHVGLGIDWPSIKWEILRPFLENGRKQAGESDTYRQPDSWCGREIIHCASSGAGRHNYRYHILDEGNHVWIADGPDARDFGNVFVKFSAEWLWARVGKWGGAVTAFLDRLVLSGNGKEVKGSRHLSAVHIACDYLVPDGIDYNELHSGMMPRKAYKCIQGTVAAGQTMYVGKRQSPVSLTVYDKGKEIVKSEKMWCLDLWGIDRSEAGNVVRVEAKFSRAFWRKGLDDPAAVLDSIACLGTLWELALRKYEWRVIDNDRVDRCTVHSFWQLVYSDMINYHGTRSDLRWVASPSTRWDDLTYLERRVLPALGGWAARRGTGENLEDVMRDILQLFASDERAAESLQFHGLDLAPCPF